MMPVHSDPIFFLPVFSSIISAKIFFSPGHKSKIHQDIEVGPSKRFFEKLYRDLSTVLVQTRKEVRRRGFHVGEALCGGDRVGDFFSNPLWPRVEF